MSIPGWYFAISCYVILFTDLIKHDCYFCRTPIKQLPPVFPHNPNIDTTNLTINELHRRRTQNMKKVYERTGDEKLKTLEDLNRALDAEL